MNGSIDIRLEIDRRGFSLSVDESLPARGITGIFGRSGAGKTTILRCIAGLDRPRSGRVAVGDESWLDTESGTATPVNERAVGYVFQEPRLFPHLTVQGNLGFARRRTGTRELPIDERDVVDLLDIGRLLPRYPGRLSGGEAQRVAIARALLSAPRLLLMDEPLSSLDDELKQEILPFLERLHDELSIPAIYVSHDIDEISRLCDRLIVLDAGSVQASGELQSVLTGIEVPLLGGREAGSIIDTVVTSVDMDDGISTLAFDGGELLVPEVNARVGAPLRVRVRASDVSLCRARPEQTSVLNILDATVDAIETGEGATVLLRLAIGDERILARITRRSLHTLALRQGDAVLAQVKSVTVRRQASSNGTPSQSP